MAKLVVVSEGLSGRSHELTAERTTVGRVEDNTFPIAEPSISSHHCEILLQGGEIRIKDLNSTNGTFIDGQQINEGVLKPGQTLRLGKVDLKLEGEAPAASGKKAPEQTMVVPRGVSLNELESGPKAPGFDAAAKGFAKKTNQSNKLFIGVVVVVVVAILTAIAVLIINGGGGTPPPTR
jgi:pSer/pThr/pTyr-binding forkhead associated (FHA) protein